MNRKFLYFLGAVFIAIGIVGSLLTFNADKESVSKEHTIPSTDIDQVAIQSDNVKVEVLPTKEEDILVELTGTQSVQSSKNLQVQVDNHTLKVDLKDKGWNLFDFDFFLTSLELTILLPEKQYKKLRVESSNGRITAEGILVDDVVLETDNGRIVGEDLTTSTLLANTDNGKVTLKHVDGTIAAETANGKIELTTRDLERSIDLKTDNGAIIIYSEQEPKNVTFITNTDNGSIDIFGKYDGGAVIGHGDHIIKLKTDNGRIKISH